MTDDEDVRDLARAAIVEERSRRPDDVPSLGRWYWVEDAEAVGGRWFGCVTHVGSNYVELKGVDDPSQGKSYDRVHFRDLGRLAPEPGASGLIRARVAECQDKILGYVRRLSSLRERLALSGPTAEGTALAVRGTTSADEYKRELVRVRDETVPEVKSLIEAESKVLKTWMELELLPMQARVDEVGDFMEPLEKRIFAVELYAGLSESLVEIRGGAPAPEDAPVHLFQRRHYMDEECLARYEAGGMSIENIGEFDAWLLRPENLGRVLPHPRSAVAFRVRRKEREDRSFEEFVRVALEGDADKATFLYLRNGERVYRLATAVDFGERLFPDADRSVLNLGKLYGKKHPWDNDRDVLISEAQYLDVLRREAEVARLPEDEQWRHRVNPSSNEYVLWDRETVYYDDVAERVQATMDDHNRLVVVLQGILDRSEALHPHPPYKLWSPDDFARAVRLVHDDSRALVPGDAPDFEAYRARLNTSLRRGAHTVGQEDSWERVEAERENSRWRAGRTRDRELVRYRPYGNPGPGLVATVDSCSAQGCTFRWTRTRQWRTWRGEPQDIGCRLRVPASELLCVDAYQPGDYRIFYDDPRTRADYLQWAPLLLAAEDWRAGKSRSRE